MAQIFNTNLVNVAEQYLQLLKAPVTKSTLKESLEQNPYYPSLYSISNVFNKFGIANEAYQISEEDLHRFEPPFITYCNGQSTGKDFILVTKITETQVNYIAQSGRPKQLDYEQFLKQWQKTVFVAEANTQSGEIDYTGKLKAEHVKKIKQNLLYSAAALLLALMIFSFIDNVTTGKVLAASVIMAIKFTGLAVTVLLLIYEVDKTNSFVKSICTAGKQTNCDAVINSKAGKIFGVSWAEAGFFYFASTALFLLFPGLPFVQKLPWLAISGTLASPYIAFSIYYQWKIVKQWCPLCLVVQVVLAMELIWAVIYFWTAKTQSPVINPAVLLPIACCLLIIPVSWYLLKPVLIASKVAPGYHAAYKRLLYNPEIFNGLLQQQAAAPDGWQHLGIEIGNSTATTTIIKVCNPYCGPCAKAHPVLEEIVKHNNNNIKVKVIFTASNNDNDRAAKPVKHLLAIAAKEDMQLTEKALDDWYLAPKKDYEAFAAKYPMNGELKEQEPEIDKMRAWCSEAEIAFTPTIFINGRRLPETYSINELKNIF